MAITIRAADSLYQVRDKRAIYSWMERVIRAERYKAGIIEIQLCTDAFLLDLNRQYLGHDYFTDIITFDYSEGGTVSGELYISVDRVRENARLYNTTIMEELHRVMIHGVLHLCGYKDKTKKEAETMRQKEEWALQLRRF